jgi:hypothetical protein
MPKAIRRSRGLARAGSGCRSIAVDGSVPETIIGTVIRCVLTMGASLSVSSLFGDSVHRM